MSRRVLFDELRLAVFAPARLGDAAAGAARRALRGRSMRGRLLRAAREALKADPALARLVLRTGR